MDIHTAIYGRRATREYAATPVDRNIVRRLIDAAIQAPSAINQQPWTFTVVTDQKLLDELSSAAKRHILESHPDLRQAGHFQMLNDPHYQIFYHAPVLIVICASHVMPWYIEDCSLAAQNLMLAAHGEGLGSCWIGFAQGYLNTQEGKTLLGLPLASAPVAPIIIGVPKGRAEPVSRKEAQIRWIA